MGSAPQYLLKNLSSAGPMIGTLLSFTSFSGEKTGLRKRKQPLVSHTARAQTRAAEARLSVTGRHHTPREGWRLMPVSCTHKQIKLVKTQVYERGKLGATCILRDSEGEIWVSVYRKQVSVIDMPDLSWMLSGTWPHLTLRVIYEADRDPRDSKGGGLPLRVRPELVLLPTTGRPSPLPPRRRQAVTVTWGVPAAFGLCFPDRVWECDTRLCVFTNVLPALCLQGIGIVSAVTRKGIYAVKDGQWFGGELFVYSKFPITYWVSSS